MREIVVDLRRLVRQSGEGLRAFFGIEAPWYVDSVDLKLEEGEIHVHLRHHDMIESRKIGNGCGVMLRIGVVRV
jgi:hypothetical protein